MACYRNNPGMKFLFQAPPALAFFDCDVMQPMLDKPEDEEFDHPSSPLYFGGAGDPGDIPSAQR